MFDVALHKVTWQQVGHVEEPGRYLFTFGWLKVSDDDLAIWRQFPHAAFTLVIEHAIAPSDETDEPADEFHLGAFDLQPSEPAQAISPDMHSESQSEPDLVPEKDFETSLHAVH